MSDKLKSSLIRALKVFIFSGFGAIMVMPIETVMASPWKTLLFAFVSGGIAGVEKFVSWQEVVPVV